MTPEAEDCDHYWVEFVWHYGAVKCVYCHAIRPEEDEDE